MPLGHVEVGVLVVDLPAVGQQPGHHAREHRHPGFNIEFERHRAGGGGKIRARHDAVACIDKIDADQLIRQRRAFQRDFARERPADARLQLA